MTTDEKRQEVKDVVRLGLRFLDEGYTTMAMEHFKRAATMLERQLDADERAASASA